MLRLRPVLMVRSGHALRFASIESTFSQSDRQKQLKEAIKAEYDMQGDAKRISYALKDDFLDSKDHLREHQKADADTGAAPSQWQKRMLVFTRLYKDQEAIPEYVPAATMRLLSNKIRAYTVLILALTFTTLWIVGRTEIARHQPELNNAIANLDRPR